LGKHRTRPGISSLVPTWPFSKEDLEEIIQTIRERERESVCVREQIFRLLYQREERDIAGSTNDVQKFLQQAGTVM